MQQAYQICALGGNLIMTSIIRGDMLLPGNLFSIGRATTAASLRRRDAQPVVGDSHILPIRRPIHHPAKQLNFVVTH